jgi:hypothetical protein
LYLHRLFTTSHDKAANEKRNKQLSSELAKKNTKTLGDYKGFLSHTDSPKAKVIREVMADEDCRRPQILQWSLIILKTSRISKELKLKIG